MNNDMHNQKLCSHLNELIDIELGKTNPDMNLIEECSALLDILEGGVYDPQLVDENQALNKLYKKYRKIIKNQKVSEIPPQTRSTWKKIPVVACICLLLIVLPITVGAVVGLSPAELLEQLGSQIFSWDIGSAQEIEGMTFIRNGEAKQYGNIEECLKAEELYVYVPTWLPDGGVVESIIVWSDEYANEIIYKMSVDSVYISANFKENMEDIKEFDGIIVEENGELIYYTFAASGECIAKVEFSGIVYSISAENIDVVKKIILGMKEGYIET